MLKRIVVDFIICIEGYFCIEVEVKDGVILDVWSFFSMVRGIEKIVCGWDLCDVWVFVQCICGVCMMVYVLVLVCFVEDVFDIVVLFNVEMVCNMMVMVLYMYDYVVYFYYFYVLDWVDVVNVLKVDFKVIFEFVQCILFWLKSLLGYFVDIKKWIICFVESGQLGIFVNGYWGYLGMKLLLEVNLMVVVYYLEVLEW